MFRVVCCVFSYVFLCHLVPCVLHFSISRVHSDRMHYFSFYISLIRVMCSCRFFVIVLLLSALVWLVWVCVVWLGVSASRLVVILLQFHLHSCFVRRMCVISVFPVYGVCLIMFIIIISCVAVLVLLLYVWFRDSCVLLLLFLCLVVLFVLLVLLVCDCFCTRLFCDSYCDLSYSYYYSYYYV